MIGRKGFSKTKRKEKSGIRGKKKVVKMKMKKKNT